MPKNMPKITEINSIFVLCEVVPICFDKRIRSEVTVMDVQVSAHAKRRMQQRGVTPAFLQKLLDCADIEAFSTDNCRLYRVSKSRAREIGDDKLARYAAIFSDNTSRIVTILPVLAGRRGALYRRKH